jgi:hypothetical protein
MVNLYTKVPSPVRRATTLRKNKKAPPGRTVFLQAVNLAVAWDAGAAHEVDTFQVAINSGELGLYPGIDVALRFFACELTALELGVERYRLTVSPELPRLADGRIPPTRSELSAVCRRWPFQRFHTAIKEFGPTPKTGAES